MHVFVRFEIEYIFIVILGKKLWSFVRVHPRTGRRQMPGWTGAARRTAFLRLYSVGS